MKILLPTFSIIKRKFFLAISILIKMSQRKNDKNVNAIKWQKNVTTKKILKNSLKKNDKNVTTTKCLKSHNENLQLFFRKYFGEATLIICLSFPRQKFCYDAYVICSNNSLGNFMQSLNFIV